LPIVFLRLNYGRMMTFLAFPIPANFLWLLWASNFCSFFLFCGLLFVFAIHLGIPRQDFF